MTIERDSKGHRRQAIQDKGDEMGGKTKVSKHGMEKRPFNPIEGFFHVELKGPPASFISFPRVDRMSYLISNKTVVKNETIREESTLIGRDK
uniref:Uncharacterized protein n=1 Tax=Cannabis sativa TaxID=3483 RepID=A0A803QH11_CANSA